jgi:hypothetical protein
MRTHPSVGSSDGIGAPDVKGAASQGLAAGVALIRVGLSEVLSLP